MCAFIYPGLACSVHNLSFANSLAQRRISETSVTLVALLTPLATTSEPPAFPPNRSHTARAHSLAETLVEPYREKTILKCVIILSCVVYAHIVCVFCCTFGTWQAHSTFSDVCR